jgi:hypothetical protein
MVTVFLHLFLALYLAMGLALLVALLFRARIRTRADGDPAPSDSRIPRRRRQGPSAALAQVQPGAR